MSEHTLAQASQAVKYPDPIPGIIPFGSLCLFAGASGSGKTIFQAEWIARWHDGRTICGKPTNRPEDFFYLAADRDWSTYQAAFDAAGYPEIKHYCLAEDPQANPQDWQAQGALIFFHRCLTRLAPTPGSLVFVDPHAPLFVIGDQNRARDVAISMHFARKMARLFHVTMICSANVAKARVEDELKRPQDRISGSGAFVAYTDTQIYLMEGQKPGDPRTLGWTPRCGPAEEWPFQFDPKTRLFVPFTGLQDDGTTKENDRPSQLCDLIPDDGIEIGDLLELACTHFHISQATFYRDIKTLISRRVIVKDIFGRVKRAKVN